MRSMWYRPVSHVPPNVPYVRIFRGRRWGFVLFCLPTLSAIVTIYEDARITLYAWAVTICAASLYDQKARYAGSVRVRPTMSAYVIPLERALKTLGHLAGYVWV